MLNSFDVLGGPHTFTVAWTSRKFHDANPKLYRALVDALKEATEILNADKRAAAALWIEDSKSKLPLDMVYSVLAGAQVKWTLVPENHDEVRDVHEGRGNHQERAGVVEGPVLP